MLVQTEPQASGRLKSGRRAFGLFEADLETGELWKAGRRLKLQSQPFKVLSVLLQRPGEVVTREELQTLLWGKDVTGDVDHSLGTAINKVRDALGDPADNPRFVETLARRGYRFIAPVIMVPVREAHLSGAGLAAASAGSDTALQTGPQVAADIISAPPLDLVAAVPPTASISASAQSAAIMWRGVAAVATLALIGVLVFNLMQKPAPVLRRIEQLTKSGRIAPGMPAMESLPASASDGLHIFTPVISGGRSYLSQVDVHTGTVQTVSVPSEITSPTLGDLSPDGSTLLVRSHLSPESEQPLWLVPTLGGSALRLPNVVGHDATWMPDGKSVLFASGNQLLVARLQDGATTPFATLPGRAFWLRWSPDGTLLRFTLMDPIRHTLGLWQADRDGTHIRTILKGWSQPSSECCGIWTSDGRYFVFQSTQAGNSDLWRLEGNRDGVPTRVTDGPLSFVAPVAPRTGTRIFFLGLETESTLLRYDLSQHQFVPGQRFLANASRVDYSRDKAWVAWTDGEGRLWRAHTDGSETIRITPDSLQVFLARWSPDGQRIALMAREPGKAWQIYLVSPEGGALEHLPTGSRNAADPSWSPDGQKIVFGRVSDVMGKEEGPRALEVLDLGTKALTTIRGSEGLFSPRWSPDGRYIAALSLDQASFLLLDTSTGHWQTIAQTTAADPVWASDGRFLYFHASLAEMQPIYRVSVPDGKLEQIANIGSFPGMSTADYFFCGLSVDDAPIVRARTGTGNLYSMDLAAAP